MHADPRGVLTGVHFIDGDYACCEGALAAGARFAAGCPVWGGAKAFTVTSGPGFSLTMEHVGLREHGVRIY